jgi:hypothetical protein
MAGYDPDQRVSVLSPGTFLRAGGVDCLSFVTYTVDEATSPPTPYSIQVTYATDSTTQSQKRTVALRRRSDEWDAANERFAPGLAGFQPLATLCSEPTASAACFQPLTFLYFDADNRALTPVAAVTQQRCPPQIGAPSATQTLLSFAQLRQVRRIVVTLRTRELRALQGQENYAVTNDVVFRN